MSDCTRRQPPLITRARRNWPTRSVSARINALVNVNSGGTSNVIRRRAVAVDYSAPVLESALLLSLQCQKCRFESIKVADQVCTDIATRSARCFSCPHVCMPSSYALYSRRVPAGYSYSYRTCTSRAGGSSPGTVRVQYHTGVCTRTSSRYVQAGEWQGCRYPYE